MKVLIILSFGFILAYAQQFYKYKNIVIDKENQYMWQDNKDSTTLYGSQEKADEYCELLDLNGYTNWRLPSVSEMKTMVDKTRTDEIAVKRAFRYIVQKSYWTGDRTWRTFGKYGYFLFVKSGTIYYENRTYPKYYRCIRDIK